LQAFDAIAAAGGDPQAVALKRLAYLRQQIETDPLPFFAELRAYRPILVTPLAAIVAQFRGVEEILHRETEFSVQWYVPHMTGVIGPFILSLDVTQAYDHDKAAMQLVVRREDLGRIQAITAQVAGAAVEAAADDDDLVWAHIQEALRFQPVNPLVIRILTEDYLLGAGTPHATTLPKGLLVFAGAWSAMFDDQVTAAPEDFDVTRPASSYLHFAAGQHACFGRCISQVQVTQILKPLLKLKGLTAAAPPVYAGTFPDQLLVGLAG
jgi:hypothetical protein